MKNSNETTVDKTNEDFFELWSTNVPKKIPDIELNIKYEAPIIEVAITDLVSK